VKQLQKSRCENGILSLQFEGWRVSDISISRLLFMLFDQLCNTKRMQLIEFAHELLFI